MPCICHLTAQEEREARYAINSHCKAIALIIKEMNKLGDPSEDLYKVAVQALIHHLKGCDESLG